MPASARQPGPVREVGVVFKTHLDIGFTDLAANIVRRYLTEFIPAALALAKATRDRPNRFVWTTGSWLTHRYLEDAPAAGRRAMEDAIAAGDFHWHALPFTSHTEFMDASLFRLGLGYSQRLDQRFGRKTRAAKLTDVPGHTIGIVPLLADAGVRLLHIGINPGSKPVAVPPAFLWRRDGREIIVVYEADYGGVAVLPGGSALSVNLTGDNLGPQNPSEIDAVYERLRAAHPQARLVPGGMDVLAEKYWKRRAELPVVESEIGDTWIHGVGTDPWKAAAYRELSRLRRHWLADQRFAFGDATDFALGEQLLLTAEHTWGMDLKTHLKDWKNYGHRAFARVRRQPNFRKVESSWREQRSYITQAIDALPHDLSLEAKAALKTLRPTRRAVSGWTAVAPDARQILGGFELGLDVATGGIDHLRLPGERKSRASATQQLGRLFRQMYSQSEYDRSYAQYNRHEAQWIRDDFTKPGLSVKVRAAVQPVTLTALERHKDGRRLRAVLAFSSAHRRDGAPAAVRLEWTALDERTLTLTLDWLGKPAVRLPEAYWLAFRPKLAADARWSYRKLGQWVDPRDVVAGGARELHAVEDDVRAGDFTLTTLDAALVAPGTGSLLDFHQKIPRATDG
ncbi:MAG: DUF5054 domain-containing protein, partial [Verrucomicrobiota bacterium]